LEGPYEPQSTGHRKPPSVIAKPPYSTRLSSRELRQQFVAISETATPAPQARSDEKKGHRENCLASHGSSRELRKQFVAISYNINLKIKGLYFIEFMLRDVEVSQYS